MFETVFAQQLDKQFLGEIGVGRSRAFFDQESSTARSSDERVMRDDAVQVGPQPVYVRRTQAVDPFSTLCLAVGAALPGHGPLAAGSEVCFFRIFTNGFHRIVRVGPTLLGVLVLYLELEGSAF